MEYPQKYKVGFQNLWEDTEGAALIAVIKIRSIKPANITSFNMAQPPSLEGAARPRLGRCVPRHITNNFPLAGDDCRVFW